VEEPVPEEPAPEPSMEYLGTYTISFYCPAECCCGQWAWGATASGVMPTAWYTVASDLPFGTILYIDGLGTFEVQDRGVSGAWIDVFVSDHSEAVNNGLQYRDVYIVR
jgi:3D (Asp-Asp-Asp) domain-containing protein